MHETFEPKSLFLPNLRLWKISQEATDEAKDGFNSCLMTCLIIKIKNNYNQKSKEEEDLEREGGEKN